MKRSTIGLQDIKLLADHFYSKVIPMMFLFWSELHCYYYRSLCHSLLQHNPFRQSLFYAGGIMRKEVFRNKF